MTATIIPSVCDSRYFTFDIQYNVIKVKLLLFGFTLSLWWIKYFNVTLFIVKKIYVVA